MDTTLRLADRCDRCGARSFAVAIVNDVRLDFCGHHFAKHERAIRVAASRVFDHRAAIPA